MSSQLYRNREFIVKLNKNKQLKPTLKKLIKNCSTGELKAICELCFNILRGHLQICKSRKNKLSHHADMIRFMGNKRVPIYKKKEKLLKGKGLFLSTLLPLAVSVISSLIAKK